MANITFYSQMMGGQITMAISYTFLILFIVIFHVLNKSSVVITMILCDMILPESYTYTHNKITQHKNISCNNEYFTRANMYQRVALAQSTWQRLLRDKMWHVCRATKDDQRTILKRAKRMGMLYKLC